jgi:hypothetical protein
MITDKRLGRSEEPRENTDVRESVRDETGKNYAFTRLIICTFNQNNGAYPSFGTFRRVLNVGTDRVFRNVVT